METGNCPQDRPPFLVTNRLKIRTSVIACNKIEHISGAERVQAQWALEFWEE